MNFSIRPPPPPFDQCRWNLEGWGIFVNSKDRIEYGHHISSRTQIFRPSYGPIEPGLGEKWPLESQGSETNEAKAPLDVVLVPQDLISLQKFWLRNEKVSFKIGYFLVSKNIPYLYQILIKRKTVFKEM